MTLKKGRFQGTHPLGSPLGEHQYCHCIKNFALVAYSLSKVDKWSNFLKESTWCFHMSPGNYMNKNRGQKVDPRKQIKF